MDHPVILPRLDVPGLLRKNGLHPKKSLGQNFLVDEMALIQVVEAAQINPGDDVLEIGAGLGSLTRHLAIAAQHVVAVELDSSLIPPLKQVLDPFDNVRVIEGDVLSTDLTELIPSPNYLIVANIPYYLTSALLRHLLEAKIPPSRVVLTIQHEVAIRITASPGDMSLLALSVQVYGKAVMVYRIPASAFYPPPKVDSEIIRIDLYPAPIIPLSLLDTFFILIKAGFSQKRKTLRNALSAGLRMPASAVEHLLIDSGIDPRRRAETLSLPEWHVLSQTYHRAI